MSAKTKFAGILAGLSTVAIVGVAVAQSEPPNPRITNPAIGAGQQSTHMTPMGETGVLTPSNEVPAATLTREPDVAVVPSAPEPVAATPVPASEPVVAAQAQTPAPEPAAAAPAPEAAPSTTTMGAAPEPQPPVVEQRVARADRN